MRLRNWLITYGICYSAFLVVTALWVRWATSDMPQDFWPVFTAEAVGGVLVAWLMTLAFWKIIWLMCPEAYRYHRSKRKYYLKKRGGLHEAGNYLRPDPASDPAFPQSATAHI